MPTTQTLTLAQARRIALAAQGFLDPPHAVPTLRTFDRTLARTGVLQVDSVNVLQRAHYMPLYSRMGAYDVDLLRRAGHGSKGRRVVEYWAHVQAYMPVELWPAMRHRMDDYRARRGKWFTVAEDDALETALLAEIAERGASTARELDDGLPRKKDHWGWNWSRTRRMLDYLYMTGALAIAGRNSQFEIRYDVPERVLPAVVLEQPALSTADAHIELVRRAARSHGVGTAQDLADYYRIRVGDARPAIEALVAAGELEPVQVAGWQRPAYLHREARVPRRVRARTLLSPFDPVVWERARAEALFGFFYRIEIYTPAHQRVHGYYVLPFLLGDRIVGRVDLKADRATGRLLVQSAWAEPHAPAETAAELAAELDRLAGWLGLGEIVVAPRGDLAPALAAEVRGQAA
ncbi:winged helix-turn-helix domain-containing protein [Pimelobacter simplex]|uniref:winged helix-turn-helix domain-containing protein n=1 Tax=Nocardioides simplex TaxID=2045 RepID=UPI00214FF876|nr:crosslink repair DNA glycosylase YcaQ family protein [Pimelobacter simplex]UUW89527.1 winged helix DNA-binding domain-containing protein [Pimelobacter simplex]UUW93356.1 winged helix DNA-binding domain-containing protein [Pimelobacter simplex]